MQFKSWCVCARVCVCVCVQGRSADAVYFILIHYNERKRAKDEWCMNQRAKKLKEESRKK